MAPAIPFVLGCFLALTCFAQQGVAAVRGQVVFQADFEGADALKGWSGPAALVHETPDQQCVMLESKPGAPASISFRVPIEDIRGCTVRGSIRVKAENVSAKPNAWNGIKFMLSIESPDRKLWPQAPLDTGSFDWKQVKFAARIPTNATAATLVLGMELVTGKVWFDDVKITVTKPPARARVAPQPGVAYTGRAVPRLRGTMIGSNARAEDLVTLGKEWNANLIRWQLIRILGARQPSSFNDYDQWLDGELKKLDAILPVCEQNGIMVALDLHSPPGGRATDGGYVGSDDRLFTDKACQDKFVEVWQRIATRYKNAKAIWGYDLVNEPVEDDIADDCLDWHDLAERAGKAIREIDPQRALICEAPPWGGPASLAEFTPIDVSNVVYSAHMYEPIAFTHQGVFKSTQGTNVYPGMIDGKMWDAAALEAVLKPVIDFQRNYNVHIYMGEFSAIRWAPDQSAQRYLKDVIGIFEKYGWDWSYHAFREWQGWSVEHGEDRNNTQRAAQPTERQKLLQSWFAKNQKP